MNTPDLANKTILIVDDEADLCEMLSFEVETHNARAITAEDVRQAIEALESAPIDVVVTDVRMAGGSGLELVDAVRGREGSLPPVILVTAYDSDFSAADAFARGAEAILTKPFSLKQFSQTLERALVPLERRWATPPDSMPSMMARRRFASFEEARRARALEIGYGGLALRDTVEAVPGMPVAFSLNFDTGELSALEGSGRMRWVESSPDGSLSHGIEFEYLTDASRGPFLGWVRSERPRAYIPRLG